MTETGHPQHTVKELADSGVAVTGGTAGIGKACARALLEAGVQRVVLIGRSPERGQRALDELSQVAPAAAVHFISADCGSTEDATRAVAEAEELLGGIDVLVNSISTEFIPELLAKISPEDLQPMLVKQVVRVRPDGTPDRDPSAFRNGCRHDHGDHRRGRSLFARTCPLDQLHCAELRGLRRQHGPDLPRGSLLRTGLSVRRESSEGLGTPGRT